MYAEGRGVTQDHAQALEWYRRAAAQGHAGAQNGLGIAYALGQGVTRDDAEAVRWYRRAAEQEDAAAQVNLASAYAGGRGVPRDDAEAVRWYRRAAEHGNASAQVALGWAYIDGLGVARDEAAGIALQERAAATVDRSTLNTLAWRRAVRGFDLANAVRWATRAVETQPDDYATLDTLALAQFRSGALDAALATQARAVTQGADCAGCVGRYGDMLEAVGRVRRSARAVAARGAAARDPGSRARVPARALGGAARRDPTAAGGPDGGQPGPGESGTSEPGPSESSSGEHHARQPRAGDLVDADPAAPPAGGGTPAR